MSEHEEGGRTTSAKRAGAITITGQLAKAFLQFISLVVFSHLLTPRDVGLIAMLAVFLLLGEVLRDFGLSQAALQTEKLTHGQATNLFWSNTVIGLALTIGMVIAAPAIASLYGEPTLSEIAPWIGLFLTINALQSQFQVQLARNHRFSVLAATDVTSQIIGLSAGVISALAGATYWALVIQLLCIQGSLLVQRALVAGWWPGLPRRETGMTYLYKFGIHTGLAQLLQYFASNVDVYIIGIRWGPSALGIYNRAFQLFSAPAQQILAPLTNVALPLLSRERHSGGNFYPLLLKAQIATSASLTFVFMLLAAVADPLVRILLGSAWLESAAILSILCIGGAAQGLSYMAYWAFLASGNTKQLLLQSLVNKPLLAGCIAIGALGGLQGVAWGFSAGLALSWLISLTWLSRCEATPMWTFFRSGIHVLACGLAAGGLGWTVVNLLNSRVPTLVLLAVGSALAITVYTPLLLSNASIRRTLFDIFGPILARAKTALRPKRR